MRGFLDCGLLRKKKRIGMPSIAETSFYKTSRMKRENLPANL